MRIDPNPILLRVHILPQDILQTSVSEVCPLQTPPPTSMKDLVLVLVLAPTPQVVEQLDQELQGAQLQSITEKEKKRYFILFQLTDHNFIIMLPFFKKYTHHKGCCNCKVLRRPVFPCIHLPRKRGRGWSKCGILF